MHTRLLELDVYIFNKGIDIKCTYIHKSLRGIGRISKEYNNLMMLSQNKPSWDGYYLYVNGTEANNDGELVILKFKSNTERDKVLESIKIAMKNLFTFVQEYYGITSLEKEDDVVIFEDKHFLKLKASLD